MNKKSRKFIKVLARKLIKGQDYLKKKSLKKAFEKAVNGLPESELQSSLQSNFTDAFAILKSQIDKLKILTEPLAADDVPTINGKPNCSSTTQNLSNGHSEVRTEDKVIERTKISDQHFNFPYNFYVKKNVLRPTASKAAVDQFYLKLLQNHTGMASVIKHVKEYQRRINEKSILSTLNQLLIISTGIKDRSFIKKLLYVYLTKMQPLVEKYLEEDSVKKMSNLQENLHKFLCVSHLRYFSTEPSDVIEEKPYYNDLIASLLSLYLDLSVYLFRNEDKKEKLSKLLYNFISYILVKTPRYKYDVLLQITQVNNDRVQLILPLIKFCLTDYIEKTDVKSYVKYIITVAMVNKLNLPETLNIDDDIKKARSVVAPSGTIHWLQESVSEEILDLEELNNDNLSFFLLENMTDSLHSLLIDSLCDKEGLELDDDKESGITEKTLQDDVIVFQPDLSGFFNEDKNTQKDADIDINSVFLIDRSGTSKKIKNSQSPKVSSKEDTNGIRCNQTLLKAVTNPGKNTPVRKIAVVSPNSHDECEPDKDDFDVMKKKIAEPNNVPNKSDDLLQKKRKSMQVQESDISSNIHSPQLESKDSKDEAEDVSNLVTLSSPQSKNRIVSPDSSKSRMSASNVTSPMSSKKASKAIVSPVKQTPKKTGSLPPSPQVTSPDHHCLRSPVTPKHCPCEDNEKMTPRLSLKKKGDLKSPTISPKTTSHTAPEVKSPKTPKSKTPKSSKVMSPLASKLAESLKQEVINISDMDEDVAIVAVTPGDKKSKDAIADWRKSAPAGSVVSDSEGTDVEMTPRKTRKRNTNIPDLSVHLTPKVRKTFGNEASSQKTKVEPLEPEPETILISSSSKEISSDSIKTPEKSRRRRSKGSKSASDSDIIEMSGTPIKVTPPAQTPGKESRRKSRGVAATPKIVTASSSTTSSSRKSRKSKAASDDISDKQSSESDIYVFSTDSEPMTSKFQAKRLSGHEMKAVLDQSGTNPQSSELSKIRSPIFLRSKPAVTSTTPSLSKPRKVVSDSEVGIESRVRTRRMSESSVEDFKSQSSKDVTPSKMKKKEKTAVILDTITENSNKPLSKSALSQSTTSGTPKKYSLRNR